MSIRRRLTEPPPHSNHLSSHSNSSSHGGDNSPFIYDSISSDDSTAHGVFSPLDSVSDEDEEVKEGSEYVGDLLQFQSDNGNDLTLTVDATSSFAMSSRQHKVLSPPSSPSSRGNRNHANTNSSTATSASSLPSSSSLTTRTIGNNTLSTTNLPPTILSTTTTTTTTVSKPTLTSLNRALTSPAPTVPQSQMRNSNTTVLSTAKSLSSGSIPKQPPPVSNIEHKSLMHSNVSSKKRKSLTAEEAKADNSKKKKSNRESEKTKGLRLFSLKVCEKVEQKRRTTYNEVADEVVDEVCRGMIEIASTSKNSSTEHKNIRRRVYDALNVLRAMGIISKEKKEIRWIGLPSSASPRKLTSSPLYDVDSLEVEKQSRMERIRKKKELYNDLLTQKNAYTNLIARNIAEPATTDARLYVPFILVNTKNQTVIECEMAEDRTEYFFNFSQPFELHDDCHILSLMGLANMDDSNSLSP